MDVADTPCPPPLERWAPTRPDQARSHPMSVTTTTHLNFRGADADELSGLWKRLTEGSTVLRPLRAAAWAPLYGMVRDRFGVTWVLDVAAPYRG
ncbi:hypothetical protein E1283_19650 [Streptomyces hainanensis]|uniref:Glyoxalase/fosfomycin resistance/dioxygenase domain-containing protein n=1 Tax=Streptomyces hainanensis TaxID=402648 RepID=A0A4R4T8A9_9ACTN|nr:hypothetical protein E1283_19650 [Streptomyces hainanensis]